MLDLKTEEWTVIGLDCDKESQKDQSYPQLEKGCSLD